MGEWRKVRLGDCIKEINERTTVNNQYEVLSVTKDGIFSQEEYFKKQIASENNIGYKVLRKNNLVFSTMNLWMGSLDVLTNYEIGIVSPAYKIFEFNENLMLPEYGNYFMRSYYMLEQYKNCSEQGASVVRKNLDLKALLDIMIQVPPTEEQKKIVNYLELINKIVLDLQREIEMIEIEKKSMSNYLFNNGYRKSKKRESEVGTIPYEWNVKMLQDIAEYVDYRGKTPKKVENGIFLVTAKNVKKGYIDYDCSKEYIKKDEYNIVMHRGFVKKGDVLITTEAPCGNVAQIDRDDIALAQRIIKYRGKDNIIDNKYLKYYLLSDNFQNRLKKYSSGGTAQGIKGSTLHKMKICVPKIEEQKKIANILDLYSQKLKVMEEKKNNYIELSKGVCQKLLNGKVRVKI